MTTFNTRVTFDHVRNTAAGFTAANPVLGYGVIGLETDTGKIKVGDGVAAWTALPYFAGAAHQHPIGDVTGLQAALDGKVGTTDARLTDAREWSAATVSQAEAEAGTATDRRAFTALRVFQAVAAWWAGSAAATKLAGVATGATANATDAQLRDRATHTGTQAHTTISGLGGAATLNVGTTAGTVAAGNDSRFTDSRTPTGAAGGDLTGTYPNPQIAAGAVVTADLADSAVTAAKIADGSVTDAKIASGGLSSSKISGLERLNPPGMARLVTVLDSGSSSFTVKSSTGYVAARWWDGSVQVFGAGVPANDVTVSKTIPSSGNWSKSSPKEIFLWSCTSANATQSGDLTYLNCSYNQLTSLNVSGLSALTSLECDTNQLTALNVSGLTALTVLVCSSNALTALNVSGCTALANLYMSYTTLASLDVSGLTALTYLGIDTNALTSLNASGCTALTYLNCSYNQLTSLNVSGCTALTSLECNTNQLTSLNVSGLTALMVLVCSSNALTALNVSGLTALTVLVCSSNALTALNVSGLTALTSLGCNSNALTSLNVSECTALMSLDCPYNQLTAAALNQIYTDLPTGGSDIYVADNPGVTGDNPSIATAKGWAVYGSD